jgi:Calcineurin-like phosphoesterase
MRLVHLALTLPLLTAILPAESRKPEDHKTKKQDEHTWSFAVSGDSRNCGDVIMPAIAEDVQQSGVKFYWHLGDFRAEYGPDEDYSDSYQMREHKALTPDVYNATLWQDFLSQQIEPFRRLGIPVYLSTGNHEFYNKTRQQYDETFGSFLKGNGILPQPAHSEPSYYHWHQGPVDFISLDNGTPDQFDVAQLHWLAEVLKQDETDPNIKSVVVGMHKALPDSVGCDHSMNEPGKGELTNRAVESGRETYRELLSFRDRTHKNVYLLASHSHFYMSNIFGDLPSAQQLPGWIVGTAGAQRYPLPETDVRAGNAMEWTYGYLQGTVKADGAIQFRFHQVFPEDYSSAEAKRIDEQYSPRLRQYCWEDNRSKRPRPAEVCGVPGQQP